MGGRPRRVPVVLQNANSDCGPACLTMILAALRRPADAAQIRDQLDPGRDGVNARDLRDAARDAGLRTRVLTLTQHPVDADSLRRLPLPLIAHWQGNHFVVVERVHRNRVTIVDPGIGRRRLDPEQLAAGATGVVLLFEAQAGAAAPVRPAAARDGQRLLWPILRQHRWLLVRAALCSLALTLFGLVVPAATAQVTDQLAAGRTVTTTWLLLVPLLGLAVGLLALARGIAVLHLQRRLGVSLADQVSTRLFAAAYRYFERRATGDLINRVGSAELIRNVLASSLVTALLDVLVAAGYLVVVAVADPLLALATAVVAAVQVMLVVALSRRTGTLRREELLAQSRADGRLLSAIGGIAAIRSAGAEDVVLTAWRERYDEQLAVASRRGAVQTVAESVMSIGQLAGPLLLLLVGAATNAGAPGRALGLVALAGAVLAPAATLPIHLFNFAEVGPLVERLADIWAAPPDQSGPARPAPRLTGRIELTDVSFRYDRRAPCALRGLTLSIEPGMKVAVVGGSGSGKSTLAKLLTGLHQPTTGRIRFDGEDLAELDLSSVRRQLGVVLQEPYLSGRSIREAIALGRPGADLAEIQRAAGLAAMHDEITALPLGYECPLGENGLGLSGGQRQRLALARALVGRPTVLLLDEATSALDVATEAIIEEHLRDLPATRVVIAHRLSTVIDADLVVVLDRGVVVETGSPAQLRTAGGRFAAMIAQQEQTAHAGVTG